MVQSHSTLRASGEGQIIHKATLWAPATAGNSPRSTAVLTGGTGTKMTEMRWDEVFVPAGSRHWAVPPAAGGLSMLL